MDLKTIITAFGLLFLAELGDKTQLAAITLSSSTKKPIEVFLGASLALVIITALGVIFGSLITKVVPINVIHTIGGILFIVIGVLVLLNKF